MDDCYKKIFFYFPSKGQLTDRIENKIFLRRKLTNKQKAWFKISLIWLGAPNSCFQRISVRITLIASEIQPDLVVNKICTEFSLGKSVSSKFPNTAKLNCLRLRRGKYIQMLESKQPKQNANKAFNQASLKSQQQNPCINLSEYMKFQERPSSFLCRGYLTKMGDSCVDIREGKAWKDFSLNGNSWLQRYRCSPMQKWRQDFRTAPYTLSQYWIIYIVCIYLSTQALFMLTVFRWGLVWQ